MLCLGLMSGTSLDGVDAALLMTDGEGEAVPGPALTLPYPDDLRRGLRSVLGGLGAVDAIEARMTEFHAEAAAALVAKAGRTLAEIDLVGFHGHTIWHRPERRQTRQIGDGAWLAARLGVPVINDFRSADVAAGGQGAPLVPAFHRALASGLSQLKQTGALAILNIGGVANVTWIGIGAEIEMIAFDTGPGNALIDDWTERHLGMRYDRDGELAGRGRADRNAVAEFIAHPWFAKAPPKSLDRDDFAKLAARLTGTMAVADGAATLAAFTIAAIERAIPHLPRLPERWLVTGGGRHNKGLMQGLADRLAVPVDPVEAEGWDGDAIEAQAFAYLAARSARGLPLTWPSTTGVPAPLTGGTLHLPPGRESGPV
jgi:anhydro-N-acetylmuramic acid kinase